MLNVMSEGKRFRTDFRDGRENLTYLIGKSQSNWKPIAENAGIEVYLGKGDDINDHLLKLCAAENDANFERSGHLSARVGEKMGDVAGGPYERVATVDTKSKPAQHRFAPREKASARSVSVF